MQSSKKSKRKKKPSQDPTSLLFWRQSTQTNIIPLTETVLPNPQQCKWNKNSKIKKIPEQQEKNPTEMAHTGKPGLSVNSTTSNEPIFKDEHNGHIFKVDDQIVSQTNSAIKNTTKSLPKSGKPGYSGQPITPVISSQSIRPGASGQPVRTHMSGQAVRPPISGQPIRPPFYGQPVRPILSGQPIRPDKSFHPKSNPKPSQQTVLSQQIPPNSGCANISNKPGQGPKFKPIQEMKSPQLFTNINQSEQLPQPTNIERNMSQKNIENPIRTIVGKSRENTANQQKKILKFQMKLKSMQEDKKMRQTKTIPHMPTEPGIVNTFSNPHIGLPNPPGIGFGMQNLFEMQNPIWTHPIGTQNPFGIQYTIGIQHPIGNPQPVAMPNPIEIQQNTIVVQNPDKSNTPPRLPRAPYVTSMRNQTGQQNQTSKRKLAAPSQLNAHQNPSNSISIPLTPVPTVYQPEVVETVFQMGYERSSVTPPPIIQKSTNPSKQQILPIPVDVQPGRGQMYPVDPYGSNYPKGIPRSFLRNQRKTGSQNNPPGGPVWPSYQNNAPKPVPPVADGTNATTLLMIETGDKNDVPQPYSPSELYNDIDMSLHGGYDDPDSPERNQSGSKRLSAFRRLGTQLKKPKLTISVTVNDEQEVREVVDETGEQEEITPVHLREDIILSNDETVKKYLKVWPWKRNVVVKKSVTARTSKTVMMLECEQMEEIYNKETVFVQVTVIGYPSSWKKEDVMDVLMENIRGYTFIPCFIEFNREECKFLTIRCRSALLYLHKCGFIIRKDEVELSITIAQTELTLSHLDFVPRLVLRKKLLMCSDRESVMDLSAFTMKEDISHFIYYPLNRLNNQMETIVMLQSEISWRHLTELNLSHNRITSVDGFDLEQNVPRLKHLNLSYNCLEKITALLKCRALPLKSIHLEGNPLCRNYIDPDQYVQVVKMMFSSVTTIDDVAVSIKGQMPKFRRNYCPADAKELADKFLQVYFRLLDESLEHRELLQDMYESNAYMTITFNYKMAFSPIYRCFKSLFAHARQIEEGKVDIIKGSAAIIKTITSWPHTEHDPYTFTVDVIHHTESTTIIRIDGILKLTRETLAEDEHLLSFSRTVVLHTKDTVEYKIQAETLYWSAPAGEYARSAFAITTVKTKQYPKIDSTTDEELQRELLKIFMMLTTMNKKVSERCLELKKWNLREALDHFTKLWKLDNLESLTKEVS